MAETQFNWHIPFGVAEPRSEAPIKIEIQPGERKVVQLNGMVELACAPRSEDAFTCGATCTCDGFWADIGFRVFANGSERREALDKLPAVCRAECKSRGYKKAVASSTANWPSAPDLVMDCSPNH